MLSRFRMLRTLDAAGATMRRTATATATTTTAAALRMATAAVSRMSASIDEQYASKGSSNVAAASAGSERCRTSLQVSLECDTSGALCKLLEPFSRYGINVSQVANRPRAYECTARYRTMFLDIDAHIDDPAMQAILVELRTQSPAVVVAGSWKIPWYPTHVSDLDTLDQATLAAGAELQDDPANPHPGFHDEVYRARRRTIVAAAYAHKHGDPIPVIDYTAEENAVWTTVYDALSALYPTHACEQYNYVFPLLIENGILTRTRMPQLRDVSEFLRDATGFTVRPIAGLLTSRDFLNALAFRVFFSTQYIRHHGQPLYTPEPDMVHDIIGHLPLLSDPEFARFTQTIGLASLGADEVLIGKLAKLYWYTVEFGLCKERGQRRAYGAGILSSPGELRYSLSAEPELLPFDPFVAESLDFPITKYQSRYFVADSFGDAQKKLEAWVAAQSKPLYFVYNPHSQKVQSYPRNTWSMLQQQTRKIDFVL